MTSDALDLLAEANLALALAIVAVIALRRPLRKLFGAQLAYAAWLLPLVAALATQFPARLIVQVAASAPSLPSTGQTALPFDPAALLFGIWLGGMTLFLFYLARTQLRFHDAMRAGQAGPAVAGILRPRIVTPSGFAHQFLPEEQDVVLAHERTHLSRQDARLNAVAALLRCLCWFNPLVHIGVRLMRMDQEMACDAMVMARHPGMRRLYAETLLKSQMASTALPFGCHWPSGADHPLTERIASLKAPQPGTLRRLAGAGAIMIAATLTGVSAWASQPPRITIIPVAQTVAQNATPPSTEPAAKPQSEVAPSPGAQKQDTDQIRAVKAQIAKARAAARRALQRARREAAETRAAAAQQDGSEESYDLTRPPTSDQQERIAAQVQAALARKMARLDVERIKRDAQRQALAAARQGLARLDDIQAPLSAADKEAIKESVRQAMQNMHEAMERAFSRLPPAPPPPPAPE